MHTSIISFQKCCGVWLLESHQRTRRSTGTRTGSTLPS